MYRRYLTFGMFCASLLALIPCAMAVALGVPPAPTLNEPIVDQTGTLSTQQIATLNQQIVASRKEKDYQVGVLIVPTLDGDSLETYSLNVARTWGIGDKSGSNGVLLLIAMKEHAIRIEVGTKLEPDLTDVEAGRIIRNTISPQFKKGDYYSGISLGLQNIAAQVTGHPSADSSTRTTATSGNIADFGELIFFGLIIAASLISWFGSMLARSKSWWLGGIVGGVIGVVVAIFAAWAVWAIITTLGMIIFGLLFDWAVSRNYVARKEHGLKPAWWAGGTIFPGGSSRGGGGGFGGFGGGSFGGGGASGGW